MATPTDEHKYLLTPGNLDTSKLTLEATAAGLLAAIPAAILMIAAPVVRLPSVHLPALLANVITGYWNPGVVTYGLGWLMYFVLAALSAIGYAWTVQRWHPRSGATMAALFSLVPWAVLQLFVLTRIGVGPGALSHTQWLGEATVTFAGFVVFGAVTGIVLRYAALATSMPIFEIRRRA